MKNLSIFSNSLSNSKNLQYNYKEIYNNIDKLAFLGLSKDSDKKVIRKKIRTFLDNVQKSGNLNNVQKKELKTFLKIISLDIKQAITVLNTHYGINLDTVKNAPKNAPKKAIKPTTKTISK